MSNNSHKDLLDLYQQAGIKSSIDFWDEPDARDAAAEALVNLLDAAANSYAARFPLVVSVSRPPSPKALAEMQKDNPHKVKAFLQALDSASTPDMLVMVWQMLLGDVIKSVDMSYKEGVFRLEVVLEDTETGHDSLYKSHSLDDAALVRHFGIMKMGDQTLFDGFYALTV